MALSYELISQFAKLATTSTTSNNGSTIYGIVTVDDSGNKCVKPDGSDQLIPIDSTTTNVEVEQRVSVLIKDHTAIVTGNISSPAATSGDVVNVANKVDANEGYFKKLIADEVTLGELEAAKISVTDLLAKNAEIKKLITDKITVSDLIAKKIDSDVVIADQAIVDKLKADEIDVLSLIADKAVITQLIADEASLDSLEAKNAYLKFASIDFANIDKAWIQELYAQSGLIEYITTDGIKTTGEIVGVTISGDLVKANTLVVDKLVIRGTDGELYKLNTNFSELPGVEPYEEDQIHGSNIIAESITAEKIAVGDLVAFGATIGGFNISRTDQNVYYKVWYDTEAQTYVSTDIELEPLTGERVDDVRTLWDELPVYISLDGDTYFTVKNVYDSVGSIHSHGKSSVESLIPGIYMDSEGQLSIGDAHNYLRFYKVVDDSGDPDNPTFKFEISAESILFGANSRNLASVLTELTERVKIGTEIASDSVYIVEFDSTSGEYIRTGTTADDPKGDKYTGVYTVDGYQVYKAADDTYYCLDEKPCIELSEGDSDFKQIITNVETRFVDGTVTKTKINTDGITSDNVTVNGEFRQTNTNVEGQWIWTVRPNGNCGLLWKGGGR